MSVETWLGHIATYEKTFKKWESRTEKILKKYRDDGNRTAGSKFNILWSNVQTLVPATFSRLPQPDVARRFRDNDPVGRVASLILERALDFEIQHYPDYRYTMKESVQDRFLGGRGTAWARYEPHFKASTLQQPPEGVEVSEDVEANDELDYECAPVDYVHWKDFGHVVARTWEEVPGVWRRVYMTREALVERFQEKGKLVPLDAKPEDSGKERSSEESLGCVYEIWDKQKKEAVWISKSLPEELDVRPDPLGLEGFFPCPKPLFATMTSDKLIPVPDFTLYQDQANELDTLSARIDGLIRALKVTGCYDASVPELARLFTEGVNGTLIPVTNWQAFVEKNGLQGAINLVDLKPIAEALKTCYEAFSVVIENIYQLTGISDIIRGQTDPNETLGAQQMKGQFASLRLRNMQEGVALYATQLLQLKAQIMCGKFDAQTLGKIAAVEQLSPADQQYIQPAMQLLLGDRATNPEAKNPNPLRSFRIEVAADTLVQLDEQAEKQSATEFLTAVGAYIEKIAAAAQTGPQVVPIALELLKWGITRFKVGKSVEGTMDQLIDQLKQMVANPAPPPPNPKLEAEKVKAEAVKTKVQGEMQTMPMKVQADQMKAQAEVTKAGIALETAKVQAMTPPQPIIQTSRPM